MKIAYACASGDTFLAPILAHWRERGHEVVRLERWPTPCDLLWIEWADSNLVTITKAIQQVPTICRLHSYEAFTSWPREAVWDHVDDLVFVAPHVRDYVLEQFPVGRDAARGEPGPDIHVIPNGIDLARWHLRTRPIAGVGEGRKIAWVGGVSLKKGPELFGQAALRLLEADPTATIHIAGDWQDARYDPYLKHLIPDRLRERMTYEGAVPAEQMPEWLRGMDVILSTSPWESFQYAVAEGIASGLLPLVHDWPGARDTYPPARVWRTTDELERAYRRPWTLEDARGARAVIERHYRLEDRLVDLDRLIEGRVAKGMRHPFPTVSVAMLVKGDEPRFRAAVESVKGHVTEVVAHIDTRKSDANVAVAQELGVRFTAGPPPEFCGAIDFAAARNLVHERCTGDWIFVLDSDELVEDAELLRPTLAEVERVGAVNGLPYDAVAVMVDCYTDRGYAEGGRDPRIVRRLPTIRWRFPVHNQLTGYSRVFGCSLKIRSTYVGGLHQRCDRSIPPLLELWRLANEGDPGGELVVNGIPIPKGEARQHAAFFLARMFTAAGDKERALPWFRICEQVCPGLKYAAPFWRWYSIATLDVAGVTAAEAVVDEGLRHHPAHPDLRHVRIGLDVIRWARDAVDEQALAGVPMSSRRYVPGIRSAVKALGLPINVGVEQGGEEEA